VNYQILRCTFVIGSLCLGINAHAQKTSPAFEALCRVKAKESANSAFRSCMNENKSAEIENIRKEYQQRLSAIKEEYEKELGRISGKTVRKNESASEKRASQRSSGDDESQLLKNSILDDTKDRADSDMEEMDSDSSERQEEVRDTRVPKKPRFFESASSELREKREPKEPQTPVKNQRTQYSAKFASSLNAQSKAILFNDLTDVPEPIPVEALNGASRQ